MFIAITNIFTTKDKSISTMHPIFSKYFRFYLEIMNFPFNRSISIAFSILQRASEQTNNLQTICFMKVEQKLLVVKLLHPMKIKAITIKRDCV